MNPLFDQIKDLANEACLVAAAMPDDKRCDMGAVNWADIGAGEVLRCEDRDGDVTWLVEISEASPGSKIALHVGHYIAQRLPGIVVEVRAEW